MAQNRTSGVWLERKTKMKEFKGIWMPYEVATDKKLSDKGRIVYSMILALSKNNDCIISNSYISELFNITKVQASRIINTLKKDGYIEVELIRKQNSKEIAMRKCIPINKYVNNYKQKSSKPINTNVKEIKYNNKINNKNNWHLDDARDYSNYDFSKLYANNF